VVSSLDHDGAFPPSVRPEPGELADYAQADVDLEHRTLDLFGSFTEATAPLPERLAHLETVPVRQHQVEHQPG